MKLADESERAAAAAAVTAAAAAEATEAAAESAPAASAAKAAAMAAETAAAAAAKAATAARASLADVQNMFGLVLREQVPGPCGDVADACLVAVYTCLSEGPAAANAVLDEAMRRSCPGP